MGLINNEPTIVSSGMSVSNAYLTFTPGPLVFPYQPKPMTFQLVVAADGSKTFQAKATLFVYQSKESKAAGLAAIEEREILIPTDPSSLMVAGVFDVFYTAMRSQYLNTTDTTDVNSEK